MTAAVEDSTTDPIIGTPLDLDTWTLKTVFNPDTNVLTLTMDDSTYDSAVAFTDYQIQTRLGSGVRIADGSRKLVRDAAGSGASIRLANGSQL